MIISVYPHVRCLVELQKYLIAHGWKTGRDSQEPRTVEELGTLGAGQSYIKVALDYEKKTIVGFDNSAWYKEGAVINDNVDRADFVNKYKAILGLHNNKYRKNLTHKQAMELIKPIRDIDFEKFIESSEARRKKTEPRKTTSNIVRAVYTTKDLGEMLQIFLFRNGRTGPLEDNQKRIYDEADQFLQNGCYVIYLDYDSKRIISFGSLGVSSVIDASSECGLRDFIENEHKSLGVPPHIFGSRFGDSSCLKSEITKRRQREAKKRALEYRNNASKFIQDFIIAVDEGSPLGDKTALSTYDKKTGWLNTKVYSCNMRDRVLTKEEIENDIMASRPIYKYNLDGLSEFSMVGVPGNLQEDGYNEFKIHYLNCNNNKIMNELERTLHEITFDKDKVRLMAGIFKEAKAHSSKLLEEIKAMEVKRDNIEANLHIIGNFSRYSVEEVEQALERIKELTSEAPVSN